MYFPINTLVGITIAMKEVERPHAVIQEQIFKKESSILPQESVKCTWFSNKEMLPYLYWNSAVFCKSEVTKLTYSGPVLCTWGFTIKSSLCSHIHGDSNIGGHKGNMRII